MIPLNWQQLHHFDHQDQPFVLVTVGQVRGSSPRETGAKMLITAAAVFGTVGGGNLEFTAIEQAQSLLRDPSQLTALQISNTPLAPKFDQCCGGHVELFLEKIDPQSTQWWLDFKALTADNACEYVLCTNPQHTPARYLTHRVDHPHTDNNLAVEAIKFSQFRVVIFGAGHVARALLQQLLPLDVEVLCFDQRADELAKIASIGNTQVHCVQSDGLQAIDNLTADDYLLIMTHSHQLDFALCTQAMNSEHTFSYVGLIGSKTKKRRFQRQFSQQGFSEQQQQQITCPIGLPSIQGKSPELIALSVTTDLIQRHQQAQLSSEKPQTFPKKLRNHYV